MQVSGYFNQGYPHSTDCSTSVTVTFLDFVSNVEGSMLGNNFTATGSKNSMKGTTTKTRKGTRRKRSAQIRRNCKKKQVSAYRKRRTKNVHGLTPSIFLKNNKKTEGGIILWLTDRIFFWSYNYKTKLHVINLINLISLISFLLSKERKTVLTNFSFTAKEAAISHRANCKLLSQQSRHKRHH